MRIIDKLLWPIIPIIIFTAAIIAALITIISDSEVSVTILAFVMVIFFGILAWILVAVFTRQGPALEKLLDAVLIWIRHNENQAFSLLGAFIIATLTLSVGWGISIFSAKPEDSIVFLKATSGYEITFILLSFFWMMFIALSKFKNEPRLTDDINKKVPPEYIEKNQQAATEHAFTIFEHKLRDKIDADYEIGGESLINAAFGGNGKLSYSTVKSEQLGIRNLMSGSYAVFRNPRKHRLVYDDKQKTRSIIGLVDLLIHLVEEIDYVDPESSVTTDEES